MIKNGSYYHFVKPVNLIIFTFSFLFTYTHTNYRQIKKVNFASGK